MNINDYFELIDYSDEIKSMNPSSGYNINSTDGNKLYLFVRKLISKNEPNLSAKELITTSKEVLHSYLTKKGFKPIYLG